MKAKVQKWGNSLGIRIPRIMAQEASVETDSVVDITVEDGKILISPVRQKALSLRQLLSLVTEANLHVEIVTSDPVGKEAW